MTTELAAKVLERVSTLREAMSRIQGTDAESERIRRRLEDMLLPALDMQPERWEILEARVAYLERRVSELEARWPTP